MFRLFLRVLAAFGCLVALFLIIGALLPRQYSIESSVVIDASPEKAFEMINRLENWGKWSPVSEKLVEGVSVEYQGNAEGEGAIQAWSEPRGTGKMWITVSKPIELIEYKWRFAGFPELEGRIEVVPLSDSEDIQIDSDESQRREDPDIGATKPDKANPNGSSQKSSGTSRCQVTWTSKGRLPAGPFYGYFGFIFESAMEHEYQKSLDRLKDLLEK